MILYDWLPHPLDALDIVDEGELLCDQDPRLLQPAHLVGQQLGQLLYKQVAGKVIYNRFSDAAG